MKCQNCDAPFLPGDEWCQKCGAKLLRQRVVLGVPKTEDFALTSQEYAESADERELPVENGGRDFPSRPPLEATPQPPPARDDNSGQARYGGFFRRCGAFLVDMGVALLLSALMGAMSYVAYKVGLSAHNRAITWNNLAPLMFFLTIGWVALTTTYFVVFHGMEGKTVGKWMFGLRVVGAEQRPVSYRRAFLRWIGTVGLGGASLGLAFLWIIWQREKRGWHDLAARTWVIRD
jgi:uncharacterized RDD family membrane protein YckC